MRTIPVALVCWMLPFVGGCNVASYLGYLMAPDFGKKSIEAQYGGLPGHSVAILIYADPATLYEYQSLQMGLSVMISNELTGNIKDLKVVSPERVVHYQRDEAGWETRERSALARALGADYVLYVSLVEFTSKEPGSAYLYRGRISAEASLYKASLPEAQARVWRRSDLRVTYPEQDSGGQPAEDEGTIRYKTCQRFAFLVAQNFYKHAPSEK